MEKQLVFAEPGEFCPNPACTKYKVLHSDQLIKHGKSRQGRQRYRCKACGKCFNERKGTFFYGKHLDETQIIEVLMMLVEGMRIRAISRVKGIKQDTIHKWILQIGEHAEEVEQALLSHYTLSRAELDGLWSYVAHKGEKKGMQKPTKKVLSGG
jgi:transposase-like protein